MRAIIGIPAYNEAKNIGKLLRVLHSKVSPDPRIENIVVISSSTDATNGIVKGWALSDPRVILLVEDQRVGKASAWNRLMAYAEEKGIDALVYMGADNLPARHAISILLDELEKGYGIVGGRPIPVDSDKTFLGWCTNLQWNLHHIVCMKVKPKVSGEMCAFRTQVVREMPPGLINDDTYLERMFEIRGYSSGYCDSARVFLKGPATLIDMMTQRRRIYIGHHQLRMYTGQKPSTIWFGNMLLLKDALPSWGLRSFIYVTTDVFIQGLLYLTAKLDFYTGNLPYRWRIAQTTKSLQYGL